MNIETFVTNKVIVITMPRLNVHVYVSIKHYVCLFLCKDLHPIVVRIHRFSILMDYLASTIFSVCFSTQCVCVRECVCVRVCGPRSALLHSNQG